MLFTDATSSYVAPLEIMNPAKMTVDQVCDWLLLIGFEEYRVIFATNDINGEALRILLSQELREFGVCSSEDRGGILAARDLLFRDFED